MWTLFYNIIRFVKWLQILSHELQYKTYKYFYRKLKSEYPHFHSIPFKLIRSIEE